MELLYLWIDKYKNIEKQGFNFSSQYRFDYNPESGELKVEENPNHIAGFFPDGISNVTAIIGENGAGKSNLLEFIKASFSWSVFESPDSIISITKEKEVYKICYGYNLSKNFHLANHTKLEFEEIPLIKRVNNGFSILYKNEKVIINGYSPIIFYSNVVDLKNESNPPQLHEINISTNYLIQELTKEWC